EGGGGRRGGGGRGGRGRGGVGAGPPGGAAPGAGRRRGRGAGRRGAQRHARPAQLGQARQRGRGAHRRERHAGARARPPAAQETPDDRTPGAREERPRGVRGRPQAPRSLIRAAPVRVRRHVNLPRLADEELMHVVQNGDPRAFEVLYDRHGGAAFSLAYRMVGKRAVAEDIVQEAFLSIWRSKVRYERERGSVRTWVLGIVH